ncbi:SMP-30/gluconolaconase/LRE-like protein [Brevibacterium sanguinis]|uniref:SMP-30/gluconolaconase/LRE-like protein n=2 Tax=Brevibacterium TaxID=1696 RepID=A0A366IKK9_9MICO|nr:MULTISPECIES: gluconolaconase [Brevibacterium]RBP66107.1 SMP-30/gluconolaconase/LRE-like protein [Brevibacterium sanguinis]RBP72758.1 SMP-30/gluconolaconase/LRE-like protein [Brevibacterium celere]
MNRSHVVTSTLLSGAVLAGALTAVTLITSPAGAVGSAAAQPDSGRASTYLLDADEGGSMFEGIAADEKSGSFYVSETTGGEIHRGRSGTEDTEEWLPGDGTDGRFTARGMTVDGDGNLYIAGGPNGITNPGAPDLWVYSPEGELLAALQAPGDDVFLNDVTIGADGAAYFTDSNDPRIFRVSADLAGSDDQDGRFGVELWADASGTITRQAGFNLGGIVLSQDRSGFVVAQGNTGRLWRFDARTGGATAIDTQDVDLTNADGLLLRGTTLQVVQNFNHRLSTLGISADGSQVRSARQQNTDPDRVLTTVAQLRGQTLYVESHFRETPPAGPFEVITDPFAD